jgi:hypothetical protein
MHYAKANKIKQLPNKEAVRYLKAQTGATTLNDAHHFETILAKANSRPRPKGRGK